MDKFDEFLQNKANEEKEEYTLPKSFEDKIEKTLKNLDNNSSKQIWYKNKKYIAMVAGFAFVFIVGGININNVNKGYKTDSSPKLAAESYSINENADKMNDTAKDYGVGARVISEENNIYSITLKSLENESKFKNIDNKEDIDKIIDFIKKLQLNESSNTIGSEWDFIVQINGNINSNIIIKDNLISTDDKVYEITNWNKKDLINLYNELNYKEQDIKYCPTN